MKIRFKYIYIFAFIFVFENVFSQIQNWAQWESVARPTYTAGTAGTGERAYAVSVSPVDNSVYTVGTYNATNLTANFNLVHTSTGDGFIVKHNSAGVFQWSRKIGSSTATSEIIYGVDVDPSGNVYVIGQFGGTVDFDPSAATYNLATAGGTDIFLAKYSSAGNFLWAIRAGGGNNDIGYEVKADGNAVYITGNYNAAGAAFTSFGSATVVNLTSAGGNSEIFCAKYSTAGVVQWAAKAGSSNNDTGYDITTDGSNVFLIGEYYNAFTIYNSSNVNSGSLTNQGTSGDIAIISYNSTGGFNWATNISSNAIDYGRGICTDGTNLYVTGGVRTNANFKHPTPDYTTTSSSGNDAFIASIEIVSGVFNWAKTIPGSGTLEYGTAIAYHPAGRIFITGQFNSNINFTSLGGTNFNSSTGIDVFAAAFTTNGNFYFANRAGSTSTDIGWGIDVDDNGDAVVSGEIGNNSSFPPITAQSGVAAANIFTAKLGCGVVMPIPNAGNDQTVCSTTATMAATAATVGVGTWSIIPPANGAAITSANSPNSQITNLAVGTTSLVWRITNGACTPVSDTIVITRDDFPTTSNAGTNQTVCATTATLAGNTPIVGTGVWTLLSGSGNIANTSSPTSTLNTLGVGVNVFEWSITNGVCPASISTVSIQRDNVPSTSNAGSNQTVCATTATLAGNTPAVGSGTWTLISGAGTITNPNSATSGITGLGVGVNVFEWEIGNGVCPSSTSTVSIQQDQNPTTSNAGSNQTVCATTATFTGNTPAIGTGTWTLISGAGTITNPNSPTSGITGLGVGINVFQWTIGNGVCASSSSTVSIQRDDFPTLANAGPNQTVCATTATFAGNAAAVGSGTWTLISGAGTITNPNSPTSGITLLGLGINVFQWEIGNGVCPSTTSTVSIQQDQAPSNSIAGVNQTVCAVTATMNGNTPAVGTGTWTLISGAGTITNPNSPTTGLTALGVGVNVFQWEIGNGVCPTSISTVSIQRDDVPTNSNAGSSQTLCASATATLAGNTPAVGTGTWTLISGAGTITNPNSPTSGITALGTGTNIFQWTIGNGVCATSSSTVLIQNDLIPTISSAGTNQTICANTATLAGNNPSPGTGVWNVLIGSGNVVTPTSPNSQVTSLSIGNNVFEWVITSGSCPPSSSTVSIQQDAVPTVANAGPNISVCGTNTIMAANTPAIGTGSWTLISGSGSITSPTSPNSNIAALGVGVNIFEWTISNGSCPPSSSTVAVQRDLNPTAAAAGPNQTLCATPNTIMAGNTPAIGTGSWTLISGGATITTPTLANTTITGLAIGTNIFEWETSNGICPATTSTMLIQHDASPTVANAGPNQTICATSTVMAANTPAVGTGSWTLISGSGTIVSPTSPNTSITGLGVGINVFQWTISNGSCPPSSATISIQQDLPPTLSNAGTNQTICATSATMNANTPAVGTGSWTLISGSGTILSPTSPLSVINPVGVGTNVFQWTISNGVCASSSTTVSIHRDDFPTTSIAGPSQSVCASTATLAANTPIVGTGVWNVISGTGILMTPTSPNSSVINLSAGANVFEWVISNGSCPPSTSTVLIQQDLPPTIAAAGPSQSLCLASSATMAGNTPAIGTGSWTLISGTGLIANPTLPNTSITGVGIGVNVFQWTISNGVCPPSSSTMSISRFLNPTASAAGANQTVCATSAIMNGNTPAVGTGSWTLISGSGTIVSPTSPNTNITGLGVGVDVFAWTISNGNCPPSTSTVSIQRDDFPSLSIAGANQTICATSNPTMAANTPAVGTGTWSVVSGNGTFVNPNSPNTVVNSLNPGINIFQWTIGNGVCASSSSTVSVQQDQSPTPSAAGANQTVCALVATLNGNTPAIGTGTWSLISGAGVVSNPNLPNSGVTALGGGINVFQWTIGNGVCPNSSSTVSIQRDLPPTNSVAGPNQTVCVTNITTLAANTPAIGTGTWSVVFGSGTVTNPNSPNSTVIPIGLGFNVFQWTIGNGVCANSTSTVSVQIDQVPTVSNATPNQTVCSTSATLNGNTPAVGTGTWSLISGAGTITSPNLPNSGVTALGAGINVFQWTIGNGVCANSTSTVSVQQDLPPTNANAGPNQTVCATSATLAGNTPAIGTGTWTLISGAGSITNPNLANTTVTGLGTITPNVFQWTIGNGVCASSSSTVLIDADAPPSTAIAGPNQTVCATSVIMAANTPAVGTGSWTLISGSGSFASSTSPNTNITGLGVGINIFQWTISNGVCAPSSSTVSVQQDINPSVSNAGPSQSVCATNAVMAGNIPAIGTGSWTLISGGGIISNPTLPNTSITGMAIGPNVFQWAISNGVCPVSTSTVLISADPLPTSANAGPNQIICTNNTSLNGNIPAVGTGSWTLISGTGFIVSPSSANTNVTGLGFGVNVFQWQITSGACPASSSTVSIQNDQPPSTSLAGPNQTICANSTTLAANTPAVGTGVWNVLVGGGILLTPTAPNSQVVTLSAGANVFEWTISNGVCPPSTSTVLVQQDLPPSAAVAGPSQSLCLVSSATMAASTPTSGTGLWTLVSGSGNITTPTSPNSGITALGIGVNVFQWTTSSGVCPTSSSTMSITRYLSPSASAAGANQTVCAASTIMNGNVPAFGTGLWTLVSGSGTIVTPTLATTNITGLGAGINVFQWTISNGVCPSSTSTVSVQQDLPPSASVAGPNQIVCATTNPTLAANTPAVGTGTWSVVSGSGSFANVNLANTSVSGLTNGPNVFQWTIGNGVCATSSSTVLIQQDQQPTPSAAGANQTVCALVATLNGNTPAVGTGTWSLISGAGTITNPNLPNSGVTALGGGINVFQWTIGNGVCPNSSSTVSIQRDLPPTNSVAGPDQTVCVTNITTLAANTPAIGTGTWSVVFGSGTVTNPNSPNSTVNPIGLGLNVFQWTIGNGVCANSSSTVSVQIDQVPTVSNATPNQTVCSTNATLNGNTPAVGTGTWSLISGAGTITSPNLPNSGVTALGAGVNVFQWTIGNGVCANSTSTVSVQQDLPPTTANAGPNQTICANFATLAGNTPAIGTGTWSLIFGSGTVTNPNQANSGVTGLGLNLNIFQWTIGNGVCATSISTVSIQQDQNPTVSNAGLNQTVCSNSTILSGNPPGVGTGTWSVISGGGTFTNPNLATTSVTALNVGVNVFQWTIGNGVCPNSTSTVSVQQDLPPTVANAGPSQSVCATNAVMAANVPAIGTGTWTLISGGGTITNPNQANSTITGMAIGPNVFQWSIGNGVCPVSTSTVLIDADAPPTSAIAGVNQVVCSTVITLSANTPTVGTGLWSLVSGSGTITSPSSPNTNATGIGVGLNIFQWQITSGVCPPSSSTVSIQRDDFPTTSLAGANQTVCALTATMTANTPTVGTGVWNVLSGPSALMVPTSPNSQVVNLGVGANVFEWVISNGVCPSSSSTVSIQRDDNPTTALAGANQTVCGQNATMTANAPVVGTGQWSLISGSAFISNLTSPTTALSSLGVGVNVFQWTISNGVCPASSATVSVKSDLNPTPSAAGINQTVCATSTTLAANTPAIGTGTWSVVSGNGTFVNPNLPNTVVNTLNPGVNVFLWTIGNGVCPSSSSTVSIQQDLNPTPSIAGPNQTLCANSALLAGNTPAIGTGTWTLISGNGVFANVNLPSTVVNTLNPGVNIFQWTIGNGVCPVSSSTVSVQQDLVPTPSSAAPNQTVCATFATLTGNPPTIGTGTWSVVSGNGSFVNANIPGTVVNLLNPGVNIFQWTIGNGVCPTSSSTVSIQRDLPPTPSVAGPNQTVCVTNITTLAANTPAIGTGTWSVVFGSGTVTNPNSPNSTVNPIGLGLNVFQWTIGNGVCANSSSTVSVQIDQVPTVSNATPNQTVCSTNATLNGNTPAVGTGTWSLISGAGTITSPNLPNSGVTALGAGVNVFQWTIGNGVCANSTSTVSVQQDLPPTNANAGPNQTVCATSATLAGNTPAIGTGTWSLVSGGGSVTNPNLPNSGITSLTVGVNVFQWTIGNGVCPTSTSNISIQRDDFPATSVAGPSQSVCGSNATLAGNTPSVGTGLWSIITGSGNIVNPSSPSSAVNSLSLGLNILQWTISNGVCTSNTSTTSIMTYTNPTTASAGINQTVCALTATITGNTPTIGVGTWSLVGGAGTITNSTSATTGITALGVGINSFQWSIANGACPVSTSTITIQRDDFPSVSNAGPTQTVCVNNTVLNATPPAVGNGTWTMVTGGGTITTPTSYSSSVGSLTIGTNVFMWTVGNGICPVNTSTTDVLVLTNVAPVEAGPNLQFCGLTATLSGLTPTVGTGTWVPLGTSPNVTNPNSPTSPITFTAYGTYFYEWTVGYLNCPIEYDTVSVTLFEVPTSAVAASDQTICITPNSATIAANTPAVGTGTWLNVAGGGNILTPPSNTSAVNTLPVGVNTFEWVITNGVCPPSRDTIAIQVDDNPSNPIAGIDQTICISNATNLNATVPAVGTGTWNVLSGGGSVTTPTLNNSGVSALIVGVNSFEWIVSNGVCPNKSDTVNIFVDALPTTALAGVDQHTCEMNATFNANPPAIGSGTWVPLVGSPNVSNPTNPTSSVSFTNQGVYGFVWTIGNGVCPNSTDTVLINTYLSPSNPNAGADQILCAMSATMNATTPAVGTGSWFPISSGAISNTLNPLTGITLPGEGVYGFVWEVSNSPYCIPKRDTVFVRTYSNPSVANAGSDILTDCFKGQLFANNPAVGSGKWSIVNGEGVFDDVTVPNTFFTSENDGLVTLAWTVSNGNCPVSVDTLDIRINSLLIPQIITPNEDGNNDAFEIKSFSCLSNVNINIFNRWGNLVYESGDYKNDFKGLNKNGEMLADDTYFYVIELTNKKYKGYFVIKTN